MNVVVSVRGFASNDLPAVLAIEQASFDRDAWTAECFSIYIQRFPEYFLIAAVRNQVVGYSVSWRVRRNIELASIAVLPSFRRHSIGRSLLASTISRAAHDGVRRMSLMVRTDNVPAQRFYRSAGFRRKRTVANYYEDGASAWHMSLELQLL
jgi:ribosomal-protein-alanine N-acetyltransferase